MSDYKGAQLILDALPPAKHLLADRGYDADWFREALQGKGIEPCIPSRKNRKKKIEYDKTLYKQRHKVENMFGKLKDWRRIAMRYDRCGHTYRQPRVEPPDEEPPPVAHRWREGALVRLLLLRVRHEVVVRLDL